MSKRILKYGAVSTLAASGGAAFGAAATTDYGHKEQAARDMAKTVAGVGAVATLALLARKPIFRGVKAGISAMFNSPQGAAAAAGVASAKAAKSSNRMGKASVVFRRIRGRIIPIRKK